MTFITVAQFMNDNKDELERKRLIMRVAQEMRYNSELLGDIARAAEGKRNFPIGTLKTEGLMALISQDYDGVTEDAYGEEKYIYQEAMKLRDIGNEIRDIRSVSNLSAFNERSQYTLHDALFLNDFLLWYIRPIIEKELTGRHLYTLGWHPFPNNEFRIYDVEKYNMKYFVDDGAPIMEFPHYLGLID